MLGKPFSGFRLGSAKACSQRITELAKGSGERGRQALAAVEAQRERIRQAKRDGAGQAGAQGGAVQPCPAGEAVHSRKPNVRK